MFDLSISKLLVLAVIALIVFGPNELPKIAAQAGRTLRELRRIAEGAKADLREGLGPEFQDFDFDDLNPRRFVQKHLFDDVETEFSQPVQASLAGKAAVSNGLAGPGAAAQTAARDTLQDGEDPPFDLDAT